MLLFDRDRRKVLEPAAFERESDIDEILFTYPEMLSQILTGQTDRLVPLGRQILATDILFLQLSSEAVEDPCILICENKRASNRELRRRVVAQVIDYAGRLADLEDPEFSARLRESLLKDETRAVFQRLRQDGIFDAEVLGDVNGIIEEALRARRASRFQAVICADEIPPELKTMLAWLNGLASGTETQRLIEACELKALGAEVDRRLFSVAVATSHVTGVAPDALYEDEAERARMRRLAEILASSGGFRIDAVEQHEFEGVSALKMDEPVPEPQRRPRQGGAKPESVQAWLSLASESIRDLFRILDEKLQTPKHWRLGSGMGAQLMLGLEVPGLKRPFYVLRMRHATATFTGRKPLGAEGFGDLEDWWMETLSSLPVEDLGKAQPVLSTSTITSIVRSGGDPIVGYLDLLARKMEESQRGEG